MQKGRFSASAEYVIYATNGPAVDGAGSPQNVFSCKIDGDRDHIAQKPGKVMQWVMGVVPPGALVLDPFMGQAAHCGQRQTSATALSELKWTSAIARWPRDGSIRASFHSAKPPSAPFRL
jgi:hypothetical protein